MKYKDFHLEQTFLTDTGWWKVTDIGTRTIIAIKMDGSFILSDPPYGVEEVVFAEYDFEVCFYNEKDYLKVMGYRWDAE